LFDHEEFLDSLVRRGATASCPSCGASDWRHGEHLLALRRHGDTRHLRGGGELVAAYFCENCGFVRLHAAEPVAT
jgi:predicted RNA-binding Zn-ribbon protein involved in translation (DUF1610 family)